MLSRFERLSALTGVAAVVLWVVGLAVVNGVADGISDTAGDQQIRTWVQGNANPILLGGWIFMVGCLCFLWFAGVLRARLAAAEGTARTVSTIVFGGAVATAVFGMGSPAGDIDAAISKNDYSAATMATLHHLGDLFFVGAELSAIVVLGGTAVLAFRTGVFPRWWAVVSAVVAVVLVIGPIGWAALIFGLPLWTLGTTAFLVRTPGTVAEPSPAAALG